MGPKVIGSKFVKGKFYGLERGIDSENFLNTDTPIKPLMKQMRILGDIKLREY
jgi:hypothetical protein